jgi:hypothetical protein
MFMPISHPWLAPRSPRIAGTEGGTQTREERSPSWCAQQVAVALDDRWWRSDRGSRMLLKASELATPRSRGVLCRAWVRRQSATTVEREPGRERPPLPPPEPGPEPCREGVVHAPAACLIRPDKQVLARVVNTTPCRSRNWQPARRAPRLEMVICRRIFFLNRRDSCH